jgi:hypothetical protein
MRDVALAHLRRNKSAESCGYGPPNDPTWIIVHHEPLGLSIAADAYDVLMVCSRSDKPVERVFRNRLPGPHDQPAAIIRAQAALTASASTVKMHP